MLYRFVFLFFILLLAISSTPAVAVQPVASYRFDETEYTDTPNEIIDSIGGFHGQAKASQPIELGKVCNAIDFSAAGIDDYAILDENILTGKTDFSVSLWAKTSKTSNQSILSGAGASMNELIMWFTSHTNFLPHLKNSYNGSITTPSIADDNWHHLVWTREGSESCLFVDKALQGCVTQSTLPLNIQSLILGQEQDSIGGGFVAYQAFNGLLDEFLIFDNAISVVDIATIYDNQNAGLGFDGSVRNCPIPVLTPPILDIHFDEVDWTATNSILDISGNDYHANAVNVAPSSGFICNAADLSASGVDDYITLDSQALNGLTSFSISLWYQTPKTANQSLISGSNSSNFNELIFWFGNNTTFSPFIKERSRSVTTSSISDNVWHHLVWTRSGSQNLFYHDGVLQVGSASLPGGALNITSLILGQEQDSLGGGFVSSQAVEGLIDELLIFKRSISSSEVNSIFTNQTNGLNYDGTVRYCSTTTPIVNYQFDESSWSGAVGEVIDETGLFNAQSQNGANTARLTPAISGDPGTCGYGTFDGVNDYVALPSSFENHQNSFTITAWIRPSNSQRGSRVFADDEHNTQGYAFSLGDPGSGKLRFYSRGVSPISVDTLSSVIPANTWTFVAAVHNSDTKTRQIYVNGVAQTVVGGGQTGLNNTYTGTWGVDTGLASIGGETDSGETANRFTGAIDEVRMYQGALTAAELVEVQNETHPCTSYIHHFEIDAVDGQGLTCEADNISIKACADASCSMLNTGATDVLLSINGNSHKTVTVVGSTDTSINVTTAGVATLSLDQTYECVNGNPNACDVDFADTGFRFYSNSEGSPIPTQLSGKPSNMDFLASTLKVQAIETNPITGACEAALIDNVTVELSSSCKNPNACIVGENVNINSLGVNTAISTQNDSAVLAYTNVAMDFGSNVDNAAEFIFTYPEAGQMQLHARYNIPDENGDPSGVYMEGSSNGFVVRPLGFYIGIPNNPAAQSAAQLNSVFIAAGEEFTTSLTAVQWKVGDDDDNDGVPDDDVDLSGNTVTKNFVNETAEITPEKYLPDPGALGTLTNKIITGFANGVASNNNMTYSEVGIISFTATTTAYLGADNVIGKAPYVGRFIPDHFELTTGLDGELKSVCDLTSPSSVMNFAYVGQMSSELSGKGALQYELEPKLLITAKSKADLNGVSSTTQNYRDDFMMLSESGVDYIVPIEDAEKLGALGVKVKLTANVTDGSLSDGSLSGENGVITYAFNANDNFIYLHEKNSKTIPFPAKIELGIDSVEDADNVVAIDGDSDTGNGRLWVLKPIGKEIRFGRANLENSFGPETSPLGQVLSVEYFNGTNFVLADDDTCTSYNSANVSFGSNEVGLDPANISAVSGTFVDVDDLADGITRQIVLPAAGEGEDKQGKVEVIYGIYYWLKYDWNGVDELADGLLYDDNPSATATFGLFRGNDRIIYQREVH